ncbi:hypothetical protein TGGT1_236900 [Toxoplasma gondii GT1]|uniref:Transmembrane protein n=2 Tax=Toxoplasma gondii TaxID=5811 RepID=S7URJ9_TOXGG|nr:hypothetical protein TGGT1_236900 [Toxoplasma gondii GT1]KAF4640179.1 hypothetical protein TGRH88_041040 [Toxoplasma gondii]
MRDFLQLISGRGVGPVPPSKTQSTSVEESSYSNEALRTGVEKVVFFTFCASSMLALAALGLGIGQFSTVCDVSMAIWNLCNAGILSILSVASVAAMYYDPRVFTIISRLVTNADFAEVAQHGSPALVIFFSLLLLPLLLLIWCMQGYVGILFSLTCKSTAPLLFAGTVGNICLTIAAVAVGGILMTHFIGLSSGKSVYEVVVTNFACDPL